MLMLDDTTALVYNTDDLYDAVSTDNGVELVYFGADFTLAYGITIFPNKPSLTFDGTYLGVRHTFTDMTNSGYLSTLGVRAASNITITFQNIDLIGRNYYGIPFIQSNTNCAGVSTIYIDVTYDGVQICHNPYGLARFIDCDITVNMDEVAEANKIEVGGVTTMTKTNTDDAIFWFYGSSGRPSYLKILSGAKVTVTTTHYFMYESYPPYFIIEQDASFELNTNSGFTWNAVHSAASFLVEKNASFRYTQAVNTRNVCAMYLDGPLTVNEGATFYMQANSNGSYQLICFTNSSCGLYINNPKSFALYNSGSGSPAALQFGATIPIVLGGGQINYWETAKPFPDAGTLEDPALHKWHRPDYGRFTLSGTANNNDTFITDNDFTPEELAENPPLTLLQLDTARVLSIGEIPLTIYSAVLSRCVTGLTEPHATTKLVFMPSLFEDPQTAEADGDGFFSITPTTQRPYTEYVEVLSNTPFLIVEAIKQARAEELFEIEYAPTQINFPITPMEEFPDMIILPRENPGDAVKVVDTRSVKTRWQLWVSITGPLATEDNDVLDDAVVFCLENGALETVTLGQKAVYTGDIIEDEDDFEVTWERTKGILARITVPIRSGKPYATRLGWALTALDEGPGEP